jgi:hypothetical protein
VEPETVAQRPHDLPCHNGALGDFAHQLRHIDQIDNDPYVRRACEIKGEILWKGLQYQAL